MTRVEISLVHLPEVQMGVFPVTEILPVANQIREFHAEQLEGQHVPWTYELGIWSSIINEQFFKTMPCKPSGLPLVMEDKYPISSQPEGVLILADDITIPVPETVLEMTLPPRGLLCSFGSIIRLVTIESLMCTELVGEVVEDELPMIFCQRSD